MDTVTINGEDYLIDQGGTLKAFLGDRYRDCHLWRIESLVSDFQTEICIPAKFTHREAVAYIEKRFAKRQSRPIQSIHDLMNEPAFEMQELYDYAVAATTQRRSKPASPAM